MINFFLQFIYKERKIPLVIYYWHLERLLTTFPLFHFGLFNNFTYYTLILHLVIFIITNKILKIFLSYFNKLNTKEEFIMLYLVSFSVSLLILIYILIL